VDALDNLVIIEMHLLSTVFERWDGVRLYVPNYVLAGKPIFNVRRSGSLFEVQTLQVDLSTTVSQIEAFKKRLESFVRGDGSSDFMPVSRVIIEGIESCNRMNLAVVFQHAGNWQDMDAHLGRRSRMVSFLRDTVEALNITYLPPIQRVALVSSSSSSQEVDGRLGSGEIRGSPTLNAMHVSRGESLRISQLSGHSQNTLPL